MDFTSIMQPYNYMVNAKRKSNKQSTYDRNVRELRNWYAYLTSLYLNMYEWVNLPDSVNERYLNETLFNEGRALFFNDKTVGYMALPFSGDGNLNTYYEYTRYRATSNTYNEVYDMDDCVIIRANPLCYAPRLHIELWANKIADAGRTIDVYATTMKRPWLVTGDPDNQLTSTLLVSGIEENELVVTGAKRMENELTRAYDNPNDGQGLMGLWHNKHELLDESMTWMGINNANTEKRERLITSEVEANNQLVSLNNDYKIDCLSAACEEINSKFGLNVSVKLKHDYLNSLQGGGDEQIHDNDNGNT